MDQTYAQDDPERAQRLLSKATGLWPEKYRARSKQAEGWDAQGTFGASPGDSSTSDTSAAGRRASQPYSFVPPSTYAREQPGLRTASSNDAAAGGSGSRSTDQSQWQGRDTAQGHPNLRRRHHAEAHTQHPEQPQQQQQQAHAGQPVGHAEGPGITATSGSWLDQRIDLVMKRLVELGSGHRASPRYWLTYCLLLLMVAVTLASRTTPWLLGLASKTAGRHLRAAMQRSFLVV